MGPLVGAGLALQGLAGIFSAIQGRKQLKEIQKMPTYQASPYAQQMLGLTQTQLNARNPYAAAQQRGILGSQATAYAAGQRNITDPSQGLAYSAALAAGTDQAMANQAMQEQQAYQQRFSNLAGGMRWMAQEQAAQFQSEQAKREAVLAQRQANTQTIANIAGNIGGSLVGMGMGGAKGAAAGMDPNAIRQALALSGGQ